MESASPTGTLPQTPLVNTDTKDSTSTTGGPPAPFTPPVACTVTKNGKEEVLSVCPAKQTAPPQQGAGLVFITGTEEDYNPGTGTGLVGKQHTGGNMVTPAAPLVSSTALSPPVPQSKLGFTPHHVPPSEAVESPGPHQDSNLSDGQIKELSGNAAETSEGIQQTNSLEDVERVEVLVETRPHSPELHPPKSTELLSGLYSQAPDSFIQTDSSSSSLRMLSEAPKPSDAPALFDGGLVVSLQAGDVVKAGTSHSIAELVHSADAREIVVVREEAHISGAWTNVHLNQSYLLQREDGTVCQAAIELAAAGGVQAEVELDSQPMEVYEFCGLVEEVAEETVCGAQIPHSPGYEVNLFNALLENSEEFTVKEGLEGDTIIFSQQASNSDSHGPHNAGVAVVEQHLVLDQAVGGAHAGEVCLVEVAAVTDAGHPAVTLCSPPAGHQMVPATSLSAPEATASAGGATKPDVCTSCEGTKETPVVTDTQRQSVRLVASESTMTSCGGSAAGLDPLHPGPYPLLKTPDSRLTHLTKHQSDQPVNAHHSATVPGGCLPCATASSSVAGVPCGQTAACESVPLQTSKALTVTAPDAPAPGALLAPTATSPPHHSGGGSLSAEEDCEDMEQDKAGRDSEAQEATSGQISSPEEGSDEEASTDRSEMTSPSSPLKVRQWIAERVSVGSSPISPSSSSHGYPGPLGSSDWSTPRREKSSPLRGPTGKFVSPSSLGSYSLSTSPTDQSTPQRPRGERHTDMAELAKHEADIEHRTQALKREGFWSMKRLTRLTEPQRPKVHWDYLCEEMQWLSADFAQERRWKRGVARKVVRMVMRHHEDLRQKEEKAKRDEHAKIRRVASSIAKEVRAFWSNVEKVVQYKQQSRLEEKRKKALDLQLDFIVGQTEKYSDLLSKSLAPSRPAEIAPPLQKSTPALVDEDDRDFEPPGEEEDDEETIEVEEQQEGNDAETHRKEIELLKEEGLLPLDQLLSTLNLPQDLGSEEECSDENSSSVEEEEKEDEDGEFTANEEDAEDEEDTIAAQEKVEGDVNHAEELDDLAREGDMSMEELLEMYKGAYAADFEAPSASGSKASSDVEDSGDEEVETEDESDVESNSSSSDSAGDSAEDEESEKDEEESEQEEGDECGDEGMEVLLKEGDHSSSSSGSRPKKEISHIAATAESLQPKGYTLATTKVKTPIPFLLHGTLREYQHIGLDWLVTMYEKKLNGILADEMGLGKTIQTIALLAHLACEKGNWGPHLIIVPTSVMLNWEMELKRWCPGFKILTYFGSQKERKLKRQGWTKPNAFHVCITSYKLVLQDHQAFRRKSWRYLILDEAQNIKNFKSQRWQSLLNFNSHRRLLLTGTPLQNSLMELWSLMHFLMPHVFQSHREFKEWFSNPLTGMIEGSQEYNEGLVKRLHKVLRPFLLRRIKVDVEKQMPKKYEHVVRCRLSKRQRFLYDDFMAQASTRETLASGHFMSVINILMQLRKVCNHPNLFDPRPIQSPFITQPIIFNTASLVQDVLDICPLKRCDLSMFNLIALERHVTRYQADVFLPRHKVSRQLIQEVTESPEPPPRPKPVRMKVNRTPPPKGDSRPVLLMNKPTCSVAPAAQTPKPPPVTEVASTPAPPPVIQQVVCSVATAPPPRPPTIPTSQTAVRSSAPKPVLTVRHPATPCAPGIPAHPSPGPVMPQRVLLSPDMQARLPSGEVVSIAQLASLAGRPVSSCQGSKPVTFQLQGNKLTLSGAQIHQVPAAAPRPVQGNVMHLVSGGVQHHLITQPTQVTVQTAANTHAVNTAPAAAPAANRLQHSAAAQVTSAMVSSPGVVKIVVRQSAGKEGGPVPTLAVAPSPRVTHQAPASLHSHTNTAPLRTTAPLQITQRTTGPATAHYTIAPPRHPGSAPNPPQAPRPVLKVVQPPPATAVEQPASAPVTSSSSVSKSSSTPRDDQTAIAPKSRPSGGGKGCPPPRRIPRPPPRSPFHMDWLSHSLRQQRQGRLDFIFGVNERRCAARPIYGREVLDFLTFLPGARPSPAPPRPEVEWGRSGHSSCLFSQTQNKFDFWQQSGAIRAAIYSVEERLELLADVVDRFTFAIPPVEAPPISMHCCHPPPSLSHKQAVFSTMLATGAAPLTSSLHRIQCYMRTQFPDLRLIQYDCGKLQTLHTLLRKLKSGGHRVLIFTQMTRMLDVLEQFLNYHGHIYLRLDGSTRVEQRQALMERFNADRRIFCFILSTRSGGVGVNLTGADTVVFYDSDWNPTMDAQAQDRCHRIGQTRDVHIYRLISERTVEENILKKANQKRMLGDMAIEGGNFTTAFFKQQTIRELFDMSDGEKREAAVELSLPHAEEEEGVNKQSTTILEQALCRAEDEEDIVAASQAKAEQVAELAEFNENIPLDDGGGEQEEVEELSKAEQEIAALVEQLTPIERYAMNFLEASLEDVCKEELKQAEEQVEAARKGLDQAKEEGLKLHASSDDNDDDFMSRPSSAEPAQPPPSRRGRKPKDKVVTSTRTSGRLRGASPDTEPEPTTPREVPERLRGLRGRGSAKDTSTVSPPTSHPKPSSSARLQDSRSSKAASPARDHHMVKTRTQPARTHPSPVPSPTTASPPAGKYPAGGETETKTLRAGREDKDGSNERRISESSLDSIGPVDHQTKDDDGKDHSAMSPPSTISRSPRKRQSADDEVLRGLVEDSPSAKVLRKLPGRLVTVVEDKEPRRRRRRGSGTGGSLEEVAAEDGIDDPNKDNTSPSNDGKTKTTVTKSPLDQDPTPSPSVVPQPVRSYPPYSPPHLSPDMPVLRNLPVRRRLETESRLAAQLGEQQQHVGRGRGPNQSKKTDPIPGKETALSSTESPFNSTATPLKRKRGRPPKTPPRLLESDDTISPMPTSPIEEENLPPSPKRRRGRPRKDSVTTPDVAGEGQNSETSALMKLDLSSHSVLPEAPAPIASNINVTSQSTKEEIDTKTPDSNPAPRQDPVIKTGEVSEAISTTVQISDPPEPSPVPTSTQTVHLGQEAQTSSVAPVPLSSCTTVSVTVTPQSPSTSILSTSAPEIAIEPSSSNLTMKTTGPDSTSARPPPAATSLPAAAVKATLSETCAASATPQVMKAAPTTVEDPTKSSGTSASTTTQTFTTVPSASPGPTSSPSAPTAVGLDQLCPTQLTAQETTVPPGPSNPAGPTQPPQASPSNSAEVMKTVHNAPINQTIAKTPQAVPPVKEKPAQACSSHQTTKTVQTTPSVSPTQTKSGPAGPSQSTAPTVGTNQVNVNPADLKCLSVSSSVTNISEAPPLTAKAPGHVAETLIVPSAPTRSTEEPVKSGAAPPLTICSNKPTTSVSASSETDTVAATLSLQSKTLIVARPSELETLGSPLVATPEANTTKTTTAADNENTPPVSQVCTTTSTITTVTTTAPPISITPATTVPIQSPAPSCASSETPSTESMAENSKCKSQMEVGAEEIASTQKDDNKEVVCKPQSKRRKVENLSATKEKGGEDGGREDTKVGTTLEKDQTDGGQKPPRLKRPLSRQSSQDSTRSSSPSSGCSTTTLTRFSHHKRTYENRLPAKKKRADVTSEAEEEETEKSGEKKDGNEESAILTSRSARRSRSSSSSTDSESDETRKENRLTRSAKRRLQDQEKDKDRKASRPAPGSDKSTSTATNTSTGGESGSDTSSVRIARKSGVSQASQDGRVQTNSAPPPAPEPEVLGKRCSALNAAAKLLAMKGRVDTPGHTTRRDSGAKPVSSTDKNQKSKGKVVSTSPQNNSPSLNNSKSGGGKPSLSNQSSRSSSRSTRQCPGSLVPPLEAEYKRMKPEEKEQGGRKSSGAKDGEAEGRSSSRGHSACSSMSSDGEGDCGGRSSRSSSNSSQRTHSISSQNTERRSSRSRAASSGSERDRSLDRVKNPDKRDPQGQHRESRKDSRRSQKLPQDALTGGSASEGTPDRVLRSVAALAAVQARSPAASTRSSSSHQRHNKT